MNCERRDKTVAVRSEGGYTLIEVLAAIIIFAIFVGGAVGVVGASRKMISSARDHAMAANLAKNRIELSKTLEFANISALEEPGLVVDRDGVAAARGRFRRATEVTSLASNLVEVTVTVGIRDRVSMKFEGVEEEISTMIADIWEPEA